MLFVRKPDIFCIPCKLRVCKFPKNSMDVNYMLWKFANLRLTSPSGPIRYTILIIWWGRGANRKKNRSEACRKKKRTESVRKKKLFMNIRTTPPPPMINGRPLIPQCRGFDSRHSTVKALSWQQLYIIYRYPGGIMSLMKSSCKLVLEIIPNKKLFAAETLPYDMKACNLIIFKC